MKPVGDGWFELEATGVAPGAEYNFVLADGTVVPDPPRARRRRTLTAPLW